MNPIKNKKNLEASIEEIRNFAHSYIEKYNPSKQQLRTYLFKKFVKIEQKTVSKKELFNLIDTVIISLEDQKFLNDKYYSDAKSKAFYRRGYSLNKIRFNLIKKGIDQKYIKDSISKIQEDEADPDFTVESTAFTVGKGIGCDSAYPPPSRPVSFMAGSK